LRHPQFGALDGKMTEVLKFARELISVRSPSGDERAAVERCAEEMRALGFEVSVDEAGNALGTIGKGPQRLLFDGHVDTVAPAAGWTRDPYAATVSNDCLYGLGAVDMKGPVAAMVHGVARAAHTDLLRGTVGVSISTLEEVSEGTTLEQLVERFEPDAVVIGEPSGLRLMTAQRGRAEITVDVEGRAAHAAFPDEGANAALGAAAFLTALENRPEPTDPELGRGILVVTELTSDPVPGISVVPARCRVRLDRRTLTGETESDVLGELSPYLVAARRSGTFARANITDGEIETYTGLQLPARRFLPAWRLAQDAPLVRAASERLRAELGRVEVGAYAFCTNGSLTAGRLGIPTIGFGPGRTELAHQADEHIRLAELELGCRGFAALAAIDLDTEED
jgi:putative selenium metabolism hydrolase